MESPAPEHPQPPAPGRSSFLTAQVVAPFIFGLAALWATWLAVDRLAVTCLDPSEDPGCAVSGAWLNTAAVLCGIALLVSLTGLMLGLRDSANRRTLRVVAWVAGLMLAASFAAFAIEQ